MDKFIYEIIPGLFLGSWKVANDEQTLKKLRITHVLSTICRQIQFEKIKPMISLKNMSSSGKKKKQKPSTFQQNLKFKQLKIEKYEEEDIRKYLKQANEFIKEGRENGKILIYWYLDNFFTLFQNYIVSVANPDQQLSLQHILSKAQSIVTQKTGDLYFQKSKNIFGLNLKLLEWEFQLQELENKFLIFNELAKSKGNQNETMDINKQKTKIDQKYKIINNDASFTAELKDYEESFITQENQRKKATPQILKKQINYWDQKNKKTNSKSNSQFDNYYASRRRLRTSQMLRSSFPQLGSQFSEFQRPKIKNKKFKLYNPIIAFQEKICPTMKQLQKKLKQDLQAQNCPSVRQLQKKRRQKKQFILEQKKSQRRQIQYTPFINRQIKSEKSRFKNKNQIQNIENSRFNNKHQNINQLSKTGSKKILNQKLQQKYQNLVKRFYQDITPLKQPEKIHKSLTNNILTPYTQNQQIPTEKSPTEKRKLKDKPDKFIKKRLKGESLLDIRQKRYYHRKLTIKRKKKSKKEQKELEKSLQNVSSIELKDQINLLKKRIEDQKEKQSPKNQFMKQRYINFIDT